MATKLIVGLGNPGKFYKNTRHNVGFMFIDYLSQKLELKLPKEKFNSLINLYNENFNKFILIKPQTYMNSSGESVEEVLNYYKIQKKDIIIIYDDLSLNLGSFRFREKGGSGGHNGMLNIINKLKTKEISRLRVGIGANNSCVSLKDWVLQPFNLEENNIIKNTIELLSDYILNWTTDKISFSNLMNINNKKISKNF